MRMAPDNAEERRYRYNTDPAFGMTMDALCRMAAGDDEDRLPIAREFFLHGIAIVAKKPDGKPLILDPAMVLEDAERKLVVKPPQHEAIPIEPLVLQAEEHHAPPRLEGGMLQGLDPWLAEWQRVSAELDAFLTGR